MAIYVICVKLIIFYTFVASFNHFIKKMAKNSQKYSFYKIESDRLFICKLSFINKIFINLTTKMYF